MPRESIEIPLDKIGIVSQFDAKDVPEHYMVDTLNIDPVSPIGTVRTIKQSTNTATDATSHVLLGEFITEPDGKDTLIKHTGYTRDFYGTPVSTNNSETENSICIATDQGEARACKLTGANVFYGRNRFNRFGGVKYFYTYFYTETTAITHNVLEAYKGRELPDKLSSIRMQGNFTIFTNLPVVYIYGELKDGLTLLSSDTPQSSQKIVRFVYPRGKDQNQRDAYIGVPQTIYDESSTPKDTGLKAVMMTGAGWTETNAIIVEAAINEEIADFVTDNAYLDYHPKPAASWYGDSYGYFRIWGEYVHSSVAGFMPKGTYRYRFSVVYDGRQESPLNENYIQIQNDYDNRMLQYRVRVSPYWGWDNLDKLTLADSGLPKRITGVKGYRARWDGSAWSPYYEIGFVDLTRESGGISQYVTGTASWYKWIPTTVSLSSTNNVGSEINDKIEASDWYYDPMGTKEEDLSNGTTNVSANYRYFRKVNCFFVDDNSDGNTFENNSGLSEDATTTRVDYRLAETFNGFQFVSRISGHSDLGNDGVYAILRSRQNCYDIYDHLNDIMRLPEPALMLRAFDNRLYAFGKNTIYVISHNLYIEDKIDGIGITSNPLDSSYGIKPIVNDYGMFWTDGKGAYWHDGKQILEITDIIKDKFASTYNSSSSSSRSIAYSGEKKSVLFGYMNSSCYYAWAFHLPTKQWFFWNLGTCSTNGYLLAGKRNEVFLYVLSGSTYSKKTLFGHSTNYENGYLYSKDYPQDLQKKRFYKFNVDHDGTSQLAYNYDNNTATTLATITGGKVDLSLSNYYQKIKFKITLTTGTLLKGIEILYRRMVGLR